MEVIDFVLLERDTVATFPGAIRGQSIGAERVATEPGNGALRDNIVVVSARHERTSSEKLVVVMYALKEGELKPVDSARDGDGLVALRHGE